MLKQFIYTCVFEKVEKLSFIPRFFSKFVFFQLFRHKSTPPPKITLTPYVVAVLPAVLFLEPKTRSGSQILRLLMHLYETLLISR
jgi:hypothetical protein